MRWKLTTLIENHVDKEERYMCEHGLAILIEGENQEEQVCLLMDTGQSGIFYENAAKMGISLENLSALLISHAHYDHAGGVKRLIEEETIRKIYVGKDFFQGKYYEKNDGTSCTAPFCRMLGLFYRRKAEMSTGGHGAKWIKI